MVDGSDLVDVLKTGRAVSDYVRTTGPAILQIHTYRFMGHSHTLSLTLNPKP